MGSVARGLRIDDLVESVDLVVDPQGAAIGAEQVSSGGRYRARVRRPRLGGVAGALGNCLSRTHVVGGPTTVLAVTAGRPTSDTAVCHARFTARFRIVDLLVQCVTEVQDGHATDVLVPVRSRAGPRKHHATGASRCLVSPPSQSAQADRRR
jgi:hypothetical protein